MKKYGVSCVLWLLASFSYMTCSEIGKHLGAHRQNVERKMARLMNQGLVTRTKLKVPFEGKNGKIYFRPSWCYALTKPPFHIDLGGRIQFDADELALIDFLAKFPDSSFLEMRQKLQPADWRTMNKKIISLEKRGVIGFEDDLRVTCRGGKPKVVRTYHLT